MNRSMINIYKMTDERESELWKNAIYVFDTSALLDFYYFPKKTRTKIYREIFEKISTRLWIPGHVQYEYLKNREKIIKKPITLKYEPIEKDVLDTKNKVNNVLQHINSIVGYTKKDDKHPHVEQTEILKFKSEIETFLEKSEKFENSFLEQIQVAKNDVLSVEKDDDVLNSIEKYFEVGRDFSFNEILDITKEGKHRYEYKIPPGYGDFYNKEKKGTQVFGDLIIWNQIIEYSKDKNLPIIFITNDISKDEDWCYIDKNKNVISPREELIKELWDASSSEFWIYSQTQFLYKANEYLNSTIEEKVIQNISYAINKKYLDYNDLTFRCNICERVTSINQDEFALDFECVNSSSRNMGAENEYEAIEEIECECGNHIEATFSIWEYPIGIHNYDQVYLNGAELIQKFPFTMNFYNEEELFSDECENCGNTFIDTYDTGLCGPCSR